MASLTSDKRDALPPHDPIVGNTGTVIEMRSWKQRVKPNLRQRTPSPQQARKAKA